MTDPEFLNTTEFSSITGISGKLISKYLREGVLKGEKKGGKWRIPKSELNAPIAGGASGSAAGKEKMAQPASAISGSLSVAEFAKKTYLTEKGVVEWLAKARIKGSKDETGQWQISADNLENPAIKYLVRAS